MHINGFDLPDAFERDIAIGRLKRFIGSWPLKEERDAYNNPLETELGAIFDTTETIVRETSGLPKDFDLGRDEVRLEEEGSPGFIPDILDFSRIVCFGISGDGAPFCFDFRDDRNNPSVIWWDDTYWRRIAPDYETFVDLFGIG